MGRDRKKQVFALLSRVHVPISSEMEEKRQLLKIVLSNLRIEGEKVVCAVQKPFDLMMEANDRKHGGPSGLRF